MKTRAIDPQDVICHICDDICKYPNDSSLSQDDLDAICDNCIVNRISNIETV